MTKSPKVRRVLHVLKYYRPVFTGEGVFLERSSAVMQELAPSVEHDLLVTHTPRPDQLGPTSASSTLSRVYYLTRGKIPTWWLHIQLATWFLRNLQRYDTIHVRTHADWYFTSYLLSKLWGRRLVLSSTLDDSLPVLIGRYRPLLRGLAARAFRLFDAYVAISPKLQAESRATASDPARCVLIPCGITVPDQPRGQRERLRESMSIEDNQLLLLFVGGVCERKDPLTLVEALPAIRARLPGACLVIVGPLLEPAYVGQLQARIVTLNLDGAVHFAGEQLNPHPYFDAADILVFASRMEGFGTVVPEAMAHGRPVVVRRLPGVNDDFVLDDETGFLFDNTNGLVDGVCRLGLAQERTRIGQAGRALAETRFGMRGVAERYLGIYGMQGQILDQPVPRPEPRLGCTASIIERNFHTAYPPPPDGSPPLIITMVDAEESFDWAAPFSRDATNVTSMGSQHLAHRIFERHGVVPIYLADYPVISQDAGRAPLRELLQGGLCEIGSQMHPWVTPPYREAVSAYNSYPGNLPPLLEYEKARQLTNEIAEAFGIPPRIYRSGRFGAGRRTADILKRLSYQAGSSISPCWPPDNLRAVPHVWEFSAQPFWADREQTLLEIPTTAAFIGRLSQATCMRLAPLVFSEASNRLLLSGIVAKLGLMERVRLSPEGTSIAEAKMLTRTMIEAGHHVFVVTYHSPSLVPGNTPYVKTARQRAELLEWLDEYYDFFQSEVGGRPGSWRDIIGPIN